MNRSLHIKRSVEEDQTIAEIFTSYDLCNFFSLFIHHSMSSVTVPQDICPDNNDPNNRSHSLSYSDGRVAVALRKCPQCLEDGVRVQTINLLRIIIVAVLRTMARDLSPAVTRLSLTAPLGIRQNNALDVGETATLYASPEVHVYA
jgi:hypothetical protein